MIPRFLKSLPDAPPVVDEAERARLYRQGRVIALVGATAVYTFYYFTRAALDVVKKPMIEAHVFDAEQLGTIGAMLTGAYGVGKLLNGFVADRVNVARFLPLGLFLSAMVNLVMGLSVVEGGVSFTLACGLWLANGYFQGVGAATSVRSLTQWYSGTERGRVYGIWSGAHSVGELITLVGSAALISHTSWRAGFIGPGVACALVAFVAALVLKDRPQAYGLPEVHEFKGEPHEDTTADTRAAQWEVVKNPAVWVCAVASALMYVTRFGIKSWGVYYLQEAHGFTLVNAGLMVGLNAVSGFVGSAAYGFVSDVLFKGRRPPATLLFGALEVLALFVFFYGPHSLPVMMGALFVYGFALSGILAVLGGLFAVDISSKRAAGMAMGFIGFISYIGATIQERVAGVLIKANTTMIDGKQHVDFAQPIVMWVGASVLSMLLAATLWKVKPRE